MSTHVGLLRAVNLGSHNKVPMADLRELVAGLGLRDPRTLLQSGNVVFGGGAKKTAALEQLLESATAKTLGVSTEYFVRTAKEWQAIIDDNPFQAEAKAEPARLLMMCLKDAPSPESVKALQDAIKGREVVRAVGRQAYFLYRDGIGTSNLTIKLIEKKLATKGTGRNWNTVLKVGALMEKP